MVRHGVVALAPEDRVETDVERLETEGGWDGEVAELLPEDRYEEWIVEHRDRLAELRTAALRRQGRWAELLRADPTDEEITRALMRERAAVGDRAAAVRQFRRLREALAKLGLTPSEESLSLYRDISRGDPVHAPTRSRPPMVGRDRELAVAPEGAGRDGAQGGGRGLLILGDAGIGKTRLVDAVLEDAQARGWHTLRGAGREEEGRPPYGPIIEAIDPLVAARPDLLESLNESSRHVLALLCPSAPASNAGSPRRRRTPSGVRRCLAARPRRRGRGWCAHGAGGSPCRRRGDTSPGSLPVPRGSPGAGADRPHGAPRRGRSGAGARARQPERAARRRRDRPAPPDDVLRSPISPSAPPAGRWERGRSRRSPPPRPAIRSSPRRSPRRSTTAMCASPSTSARSSTSGFGTCPVTRGPSCCLPPLCRMASPSLILRWSPASSGRALRRRSALRCAGASWSVDASGLRFRHPLLRDAARRQLDPEQLIDAHLRAAARLERERRRARAGRLPPARSGPWPRGGAAAQSSGTASGWRRRISRRPAVGGAGPRARARRGPG